MGGEGIYRKGKTRKPCTLDTHDVLCAINVLDLKTDKVGLLIQRIERGRVYRAFRSALRRRRDLNKMQIDTVFGSLAGWRCGVTALGSGQRMMPHHSGCVLPGTVRTYCTTRTAASCSANQNVLVASLYLTARHVSVHQVLYCIGITVPPSSGLRRIKSEKRLSWWRRRLEVQDMPLIHTAPINKTPMRRG